MLSENLCMLLDNISFLRNRKKYCNKDFWRLIFFSHWKNEGVKEKKVVWSGKRAE